MAQDFQIGDLLADGSGCSHGRPRSVFNAATHNDALSPKAGVGRVISELRHEVGCYNRQAGPSVKNDRNEKRRLPIRGFEQKVNYNG